jgi:hypothetical protein
MSHFLPTDFDPAASALIAMPAAELTRPVECSEPLVETTVIESKHGLLVPLVNWSGKPVKPLRVTLNFNAPAKKVSLAGGGSAKVAREEGKTVVTFDLDVADALILR